MGLLAIGGGLLFVYICTSKTLKDIYEIMLLETEIEYGREGLIMDHSSDDKKYLDFYKKVFVKRKCMSYIPIVNLIVAKKNTDQIKDEFQSFFASDSSGIIKLSRIQANMIDSAETFEEAYSIINEYRKTKLNNESNIVLNAFNELVPLSYSLNEVREISGRLNKPYVLGKIDGLNVALIDFDIKKDTDLEFLYEQKRLILSDESEVVNNRFKIYVNNYEDALCTSIAYDILEKRHESLEVQNHLFTSQISSERLQLSKVNKLQ